MPRPVGPPPAASALHSFEMTRWSTPLTCSRCFASSWFPSSSWPFWTAATPWRWRCLHGAALTDILDGAVARRFRLATPAGAWLDPVADKCLLSGVFLALAAAGTVPWWLVGIVFGRDFYILAGAATVMLLTPVRKFPPSIWGKVSTLVQIVTAVACDGRKRGRVLGVNALALRGFHHLERNPLHLAHDSSGSSALTRCARGSSLKVGRGLR